MAQVTAAAIISAFLQRYPDARSASSATELDLLNGTHDDVCHKIRLYFDTFTFNVTADEDTYDLDALDAGAGGMLGADILSIFGMEWVQSSADNDFTPIREADSIDKDYRSPGWRLFTSEQRATQFMIESQADESQSIILFPKPSASTDPATSPVTGYPRVVLHAQCSKTLTTSSNLPRVIRTNQLHLAGMCERWALVHDREAAPGWNALFRKELHDLKVRVEGQAALKNPNIRPRMPSLGRVT